MAEGQNPHNQKSLPTLVSELWELTVSYVKQETVEPMKALGRFVGAGVAGSVLIALGLVLLVLGLLRALQMETGTMFRGDLSWAPYLITLVFCAIVAVMAVRAISKEKRRSSR